jgi:hypothetical protein
MTVSGVPNIRVIIREPDDENLLVDVPNINVKVLQDNSYNVNVTPPVVVSIRSGSYNRFVDVALLAYTASYISGSGIVAEFATSASYAESINRQISGAVGITGSVSVNGAISASGAITGSAILSNEFVLSAGTVSIVFTGSINTGIFGTTEYIYPYISTTEYSGMTVEYLAQRPNACRMGIIMASWLDTASVVFTDISTTDIGDTSDISFRFLSSSNELRLRVNSNGSGSGTWTVQSLFKLFPNLNS